MKLKKLLSAIISIVMIASCIVVPVSANQAIYTEANGWTLPTSSEGAIAAELADGRLQMNNEVRFTPELKENKKYSIKFDVTGLETGDAWTYQFRLALISGGTTLDGSLSYRQAGVWENGNKSKWLASDTDGEIEVIIDRETGEYEMYALGVFSAAGTFADTSDFTLKFYKWGGNAPYISNVRVEELNKNATYNAANGWTLPVNDDGVKATELADGRLQLNNEAIFKPTLEAGKKYSIKYDVTDLAIEAGSWTFPFRVKMSAGGTTTDGILAYRMANVWEARNLAIASGNGTNEIIIDTEAKTWEAYALGSLSQYGTVESFDGFALTFYKWGGPSACIGNVTVEDITSDEICYEQNFDQIGAEFSNWRAATVNEVRATQPLKVWNGSFGTTGENKYLLSGAMDIYPLAVTEKSGVYAVNFDIKPNAAKDPNGSNWEGIVMQWNLGSSNSDSWHDMKIGTSQGANVSGEVTIDRLWIFGQEMVIDPTNWINVRLVYNCMTGRIDATVVQGNTSVTASAGFKVDAASLTGSPKLTFEGIERNGVKYAGIYLDNIVIKKEKENIIYTPANGWTLPANSEGVSATELADGKLQINNNATFKPALEAGKKYSIKYDVTGLEKGDAWTFPFRVKMSAGGTETDGILAYRMEGVWEARNLAIAHGNGTNEIIIDTEKNTWEAYALGSLSQYGTVASFNDFALTFYKWGGPSACIGNVTVEDITADGICYEQDFDEIDAEFDNWRAATVNEVRATQPLKVWGGSFGTTGEDKHLLSGSMDIFPLAVTTKTDNYQLSFDIKPNDVTDPNGSNWEGIVMQWNLGSSNADSWHDMKIGTSQGANIEGEVAIDRLWIFGKEMVIDPTKWINVKLIYICSKGTIEARVTQGNKVVTASAGFAVDTASLSGSPKVTFEGIERNGAKYSGVYLDNIVIKEIDTVIPVVYTPENGWTLLEDGMSATEQADGSLKIGKGASNAAQFTPDLEYGKAYEITYDVSGLEVVDGSWKKPITVTLSAGGQTETDVLTYRMAGAWRNVKTDEKYVSGSNGTNKIIIDTATGEWEAYALGEKATYSGHTTIMNGSEKSYYEFSDTSDFTISLYAYDTSDGFSTPYISNVKVTEIAPVDYTNEVPVLSSYKIKSKGTEVDSPIGLSNFDVELNFKPEARKSGKVIAMVGVYDSKEVVVASGYETKTIKAADNSIVVNVSLDAPYTADNTCKVFVWDGTGSLRPLIPVICPTEKIFLNKVADNAELHNDLMAAYLNDSYENVAEYAWGGMDKDDPKPVDFEWATSNVYPSYTLEISENEDMSNAREIVTNKNSCEVYNLKVGTRYYWRVKATDENGAVATSSVSTFTTKEGAPRYIQVAGLTNGRDVGGWTTASGKKVKQGMIYRSYCFDYVKDDKTVTLVTSEGIDTLVNTLKIRTEIDLRGESEKTSSILGDSVNYYRFGMNYNDDMMSGNKETIKNVFNLLADKANYPIIWHCQAGADRTGVMTYLLNGLLGVSKEDLLRDYLLTNFAFNDNSSRDLAGIEAKYVKTLDEYEGKTLSEKIYNYLNVEIGISAENLDKIRDYMIEE